MRVMYSHKKINKDFFKTWSGDMAYILGFFAADGYMTVNKRGGQFWCFDIKDLTLLKGIKAAIESDHKISTRYRRERKSISFRLQIGSIEMCDDLRKLGFGPNKTLRLWMPNIPNEYFGDFVRGYFDGDGCVWTGYIHKSRRVWSQTISIMFTSCSNEFLLALKNRLEMFGIEKGVLSRRNPNYSRLVYSVRNSLKIYDFMYNRPCNLFLFRKKVIFDDYKHTAGVAQLVRAPACHAGGRGFESHHSRRIIEF